MAASGGPSEAHHRAESREEQKLIELAAKSAVARPGENLIADHLTLRVNGDVHKQAMRKREGGFGLIGAQHERIFREGNELRGTHQIYGHIVLDGAHGDARND